MDYRFRIKKNLQRESPTTKNSTIIDYLICEPSLFEEVFTCDTNLKSDHFSVVWIFNYAKQPRLIKYIHNKSNYKKIKLPNICKGLKLVTFI